MKVNAGKRMVKLLKELKRKMEELPLKQRIKDAVSNPQKSIINIITYIKSQNFIKNYLKDAVQCRGKKQLHDFALSIVNKDFTWWAEFGVFQGKSLKYIASKAPQDITVYGFDSFEGLPEKWEKYYDKGGFRTKIPKINIPNVHLIKGWFNESLPPFLNSNKLDQIGFINIDCDLYSSTKLVLDILTPYISSGTVIVFDELYSYQGYEKHEFKAFNEWVEENNIKFKYRAYNLLRSQICVRIL